LDFSVQPSGFSLSLVIVEIINTGSELMLGRVLNTHQQWLCRQLADLGYVVSRQVAVADRGSDIQQAVHEALSRVDLVITTGGLGPTSDDITRDCIAQLLGKPLVEDQTVLAHIRQFFDVRNRTMPDRTRIQAMVPEGTTVIANAHGTAPGLWVQIDPNPFRPRGIPSWLVMLPGPPRELRPMFAGSVLPLLKHNLPTDGTFVCHTLRTTGIGESAVEEMIATPLEPLTAAGLDIGYCARPGQVDLRLAARGPSATKCVIDAEAVVKKLLGPYLYGSEEEELETRIIQLLTERKQTLALAESCTGGCIAHRLTNVPGASAVLLAGLVTYSNEAKQKFLGVKEETLAANGAVSQAVAREMALGARLETGAEYGLSVTGIAGPSGGTGTKPVGTVYIGLADNSEVHVIHNLNPYDRETFKQVTAQQALELLRRRIVVRDGH
jgi:nicotinamide-nucleotide amidase